MRTQLLLLASVFVLLGSDGQDPIQGAFGYKLGDVYKHEYKYELDEWQVGTLTMKPFPVKPGRVLPNIKYVYINVTPSTNRIYEIHGVILSKTSGYSDEAGEAIHDEIESLVLRYLAKYPVADFSGSPGSKVKIDTLDGRLDGGRWEFGGKGIKTGYEYGGYPNKLTVEYWDENLSSEAREEAKILESAHRASLEKKLEQEKNAERARNLKANEKSDF